MKNVISNTLVTCTIVVTLLIPFFSFAKMDKEIKSYTENLRLLFECDNNINCFKRFYYREKRNDFVLHLSSIINEKYNPERLNELVDIYGQQILAMHAMLASDDEKVSVVSFIFDSGNIEVDTFIRNNLNLVYVLQYSDSYFLIVSDKNGMRTFRHEILTSEDLVPEIEKYLN